MSPDVHRTTPDMQHETASEHASTNVPSQLYFAYANDSFGLGEFDVKAVHPAELLGCPAAFAVIGESHYVGLPSLYFHELCSCRPVDADPTHETPLSVGVGCEFRFDGDYLEAATTVAGRPLDAFPGPDDATVAYRFGPEAWTTISVGPAGYETYHTYPERGLALYTETRLTLHDARPADGRTTNTSTEHSP